MANDFFAVSELTNSQTNQKNMLAEGASFSHSTNCINKAGCDHKQLCGAHQYFKGHVAGTPGMRSMTSQMKGITH